MILQALHQLAVDEELLGDPDYELKKLPYLVELSSSGERHSFVSTHYTPEPRGGSKKTPKPVARQFPVPREPGRTSGDRAFFLFDKAEYVFGIDPAGKRKEEKLAIRSGLFRKKVAACAEETGDEAVLAVLRFLDDIASGQVEVVLPEGCNSNDLFTFRWHQDESLVFARPAVRAYWKALRRAKQADAGSLRCLVTGEHGVPAKRHSILKYVPGATSSGVPLVSFNRSAFESYGWSGNENAPVSQEAAESYATALRRLLHPAPPDPADPRISLPRQNVRIADDTVVCYWAREPVMSSIFASVMEVNPEQVGSQFHSIWAGMMPPELDRPDDFYAITLSGSQGRVITRGWIRTSVGEAARNVSQYFEDLHLCRLTPPPKKGGHLPAMRLKDLVRSLAPFGNEKNVPKNLAQAIFEAALRDRPFPLSVLQRALIRERAEVGLDGWADLNRRDARRALIKATLIRRKRFKFLPPTFPDLGDTMDHESENPGYVLGRLMAVIEQLQKLALDQVNATVVDRFFGAASATPRAVFVRLLKNSRHHARKAKDSESKKGRAIYYESMLDELSTRFDPKKNGFPTSLSLEDQGLFILGYHQQRHDFYQKKDSKNAAQEAA